MNNRSCCRRRADRDINRRGGGIGVAGRLSGKAQNKQASETPRKHKPHPFDRDNVSRPPPCAAKSLNVLIITNHFVYEIINGSLNANKAADRGRSIWYRIILLQPYLTWPQCFIQILPNLRPTQTDLHLSRFLHPKQDTHSVCPGNNWGLRTLLKGSMVKSFSWA